MTSAQVAIVKRLLEIGDDAIFWALVKGDDKYQEWQDLRKQLDDLGGVESLDG